MDCRVAHHPCNRNQPERPGVTLTAPVGPKGDKGDKGDTWTFSLVTVTRVMGNTAINGGASFAECTSGKLVGGGAMSPSNNQLLESWPANGTTSRARANGNGSAVAYALCAQ